jgi:hypothetical protein
MGKVGEGVVLVMVAYGWLEMRALTLEEHNKTREQQTR